MLDSSIGGCHVRLPTAPVLYSGEHLFDTVSGLLIHSGAIHDVVEHLDEAILQQEVFDEAQQQEVFDEAQQQALYDEHWPRLPSYHLNSREGSESSDASSVSEIEVEHLSLGDWRELNRAFRTWAQACWHNDSWHNLCIRAFQGWRRLWVQGKLLLPGDVLPERAARREMGSMAMLTRPERKRHFQLRIRRLWCLSQFDPRVTRLQCMFSIFEAWRTVGENAFTLGMAFEIW